MTEYRVKKVFDKNHMYNRYYLQKKVLGVWLNIMWLYAGTDKLGIKWIKEKLDRKNTVIYKFTRN